MIDPRDALLQAGLPIIPVPLYGALTDISNGQRLLLAQNGVFLHTKLDWLDAIIQIGVLDGAPLPFGTVAPYTRFAFGKLPLTLLNDFIEAGRAALPNEIAGGLIYNRTDRTVRLVIHDTLHSSAASVEYRQPLLSATESLAVDLHSHGCIPAFFSSTDDADDSGIKVCGVFGNLDCPDVSAAFRLAVCGRFVPLPHPWVEMPRGRFCAPSLNSFDSAAEEMRSARTW